MDEILGFYSNTKGPAEMEKAAINAFILSATKVLGSNSKVTYIYYSLLY